jgi:general secretion pathway protein J
MVISPKSNPMARGNASAAGFTLVEVLIAMAITALISVVAYTGLSSALSGAESLRSAIGRAHNINQTWALLSRDLRQVVNRPVVDEFGQVVPALMGGEMAREPLSLTRAGWHNSSAAPRSTLQRVRWWLEDERLWRGYFPVLDRTAGTETVETAILEGVERFELRFLPALSAVESDRNDVIDRRDWRDSWIADLSQPGQMPSPPAAVEVLMEVAGLGELRRTYVLPSQ